MGTSSISVGASHGLLVSYIFKSFILLHAKVIIIPVGVFSIYVMQAWGFNFKLLGSSYIVLSWLQK